MHARVTTYEAAPGRLDDLIQIFREVGIPGTREEKGYIQNLLLTDRRTGRALSISLWETEADLQSSMSGHQQRTGQASDVDFLKGAPTTETYEVSAQAEP